MQGSELIARESDERAEVFRFERTEQEYPFVDVSFALRALHGRTKIHTDGPYKMVTSTPNSRIAFRQRPEFSPNLVIETSVTEEHKLELATKLADIVFEISEIKVVSEQE